MDTNDGKERSIQKDAFKNPDGVKYPPTKRNEATLTSQTLTP